MKEWSLSGSAGKAWLLSNSARRDGYLVSLSWEEMIF